MKFNNKTYDILVYLCQIVIPAIGACWYAIAEIWNLPFGMEILGTITAIDTLLGTLLKLSSINYYKQEEIEVIVNGDED